MIVTAHWCCCCWWWWWWRWVIVSTGGCCVGDWWFNWTPMPSDSCRWCAINGAASVLKVCSGEPPACLSVCLPASLTAPAPARYLLWFMRNVRRDDYQWLSQVWRLAKGQQWKAERRGKEGEMSAVKSASKCLCVCLAIFIIIIVVVLLSALSPAKGRLDNYYDAHCSCRLLFTLFWALFSSFSLSSTLMPFTSLSYFCCLSLSSVSAPTVLIRLNFSSVKADFWFFSFQFFAS